MNQTMIPESEHAAGISIRDTLTVEATNVSEALTLLFRDFSKYRNRVKNFYLLSLIDARCDTASLARTSYFFFRYVDDVLDGDRFITSNPLEHVLQIRKQIETDRYDDTIPVSKLADYSLRILQSRGNKDLHDDPKADYLGAIDLMIFDHRRAQTRMVLTREQLEAYYYAAFAPVVNVMLMGFSAPIRVTDVPALAYCQGRLYSIKDIAADWEKGIINIPQEVLESAHLDAHASLQDVQASSQVHTWWHEQLTQSRADLQQLETQLSTSGETLNRMTRLGCKSLIRPMYKIIDTQTNYLRGIGEG